MEFFIKFIELYKKINLKFKLFKYRKYINSTQNSNGVKNIIGKDYSVRFDSVFEERKKEIQKEIENIVKSVKNNPYKLIEYIEEHGTKVYKIKNANKILAVIDETEGFITPKKGIKALYLNFIINKTFSAAFNECFIMRDLAVDPYYTIHQFYNWYAFKSGFAGYEYEAQEKFKKVIYSKNRKEDIDTLSIADILAVKEAIHRDVEAINFVINLAKNTDGTKQAFQKIIKKTSSVNI